MAGGFSKSIVFVAVVVVAGVTPTSEGAPVATAARRTTKTTARERDRVRTVTGRQAGTAQAGPTDAIVSKSSSL